MSIPKSDAAFSTDDLRASADAFIAAGQAYWDAAHKAGIAGAIIWLDTTAGFALFTRGEYRQQLMRNVHDIGSRVVSFGAAEVEADHEADRPSR